MNTEELRKQVSEIKWWHTIDLGSGIITPGLDRSFKKLEKLKMPGDLSGITVLDVGAWDGFFSFEAERRGAKRVLATDSFCWGGDGWGTKAGFDFAKKVLNSKIDEQEIDVMDISPGTVGVFDLVLFLGVLYHMRDPVRALERVASVTGKQLVLETQVDLLQHRRPVAAFYPKKELNNDPTNWWGPNVAAVVEMLTTVGFKKVHVVTPPRSLLYRIAKAIYMKFKKGWLISETIWQDRVVIHAWK